jgi:hypothetical protein
MMMKIFPAIKMMVSRSYVALSILNNFFSLQVSETFAGSDLHYKIPFWIGVIVITLLFLSAIIASIRYCFYTLCASHTGKAQYISHIFHCHRVTSSKINLNTNISLLY